MATFDLDVLILADKNNAQRLLDALLEAGIGTAALTKADDVISTEITVFKDKVRIDVQSFTPGLSFEDAWANRVTMKYQGQEFYVASKPDLISSKKGAGRPVDLEDVRLLEIT